MCRILVLDLHAQNFILTKCMLAKMHRSILYMDFLLGWKVEKNSLTGQFSRKKSRNHHPDFSDTIYWKTNPLSWAHPGAFQVIFDEQIFTKGKQPLKRLRARSWLGHDNKAKYNDVLSLFPYHMMLGLNFLNDLFRVLWLC